MTEEQRKEREHYHTYESCEGITGHVNRICDLEELACDMWDLIGGSDLTVDAFGPCARILERMRKLGLVGLTDSLEKDDVVTFLAEARELGVEL